MFLVLIILLAAGLRLYRLGQNPPSLYWDEVSLGYNAYSILKTGRDEHGSFLPLDRFVAFGDYKPPGYIYATVPFIGLFGLTETAVRLPSALAGIVAVLLTYFLVKELFAILNSQFSIRKLALLASLLLAISPWHLQMSRAAFEANLALTFNLAGVYFFFRGLNKKHWLWLLSSLSFMLAFYTFNANRIISLLLVLGLGLFFAKNCWQKRRPAAVAILLACLLCLPSVKFLLSSEGQLRFKEVSIFNNLDPLQTSNQQIAWLDNSLIARVLFNRRLNYGIHFLRHYFDHFEPEYLFISGDRNPRFSTQDMGIFYLFELPLLLVGVYQLIKLKDRKLNFLIFWWLAALIPSALAKETPHALRTLSVIPVPQIIAALGVVGLWRWLKNKKALLVLYVGLIGFNLICFFHSYWVHWPIEAAGEWQSGYKQAIMRVKELENNYDQVVVSDFYGRPYIYFLFYNQYPPADYWQQRQAYRDSFLLWHVDQFAKYWFGLDKLDQVTGKSLIVAGADEAVTNCQPLETINLPDQRPIIKICELIR